VRATADAGRTWTTSDSRLGPDAAFQEFDVVTSTTIWAWVLHPDGAGTLVRSTDAGRTWREVAVPLPRS
jgi:hypothetical protein